MNEQEYIWVVDDDRAIRWVLEKALTRASMRIRCFDNADTALHSLEREVPDAIVSDIRMPGTDGFSLLERVRHNYPGLPVIVMTAYADLDRAVAAFQGGAFEYLAKPFDVEEAVAIIRRAVRGRANKLREDVGFEPVQASEIIGSAPAMQEVFRAIGRLSRSNITVLLTGESGTGKELIACALHRHSPTGG